DPPRRHRRLLDHGLLPRAGQRIRRHRRRRARRRPRTHHRRRRNRSPSFRPRLTEQTLVLGFLGRKPKNVHDQPSAFGKGQPMDPNRPKDLTADRLPPALPHRGQLFRLRWPLYALAAAIVLVPVLWPWPAAYPWDHGSPCVTEPAAAQTAAAEGLSEPFLKPTVPSACVGLATLVARRNATRFP